MSEPTIPMPTIFWNTDEECWSVEHGPYIRVNFLEDNQVLVCGSLMSMEISYDQITEERGILFKESKS